MKNFNVTLAMGDTLYTVRLSVHNISPVCYRVMSIPLMLDGDVRQNNFVVTDIEEGSTHPYRGIFGGSIPTYTELKPNEEIVSQEIDLKPIYFLEGNKNYDVYYQATWTYKPCDNPDKILMGLFESNHIEIAA